MYLISIIILLEVSKFSVALLYSYRYLARENKIVVHDLIYYELQGVPRNMGIQGEYFVNTKA